MGVAVDDTIHFLTWYRQDFERLRDRKQAILAAWTYYKHGFVDIKIAALICIGFIIGGLFGAQWAVTIPKEMLRRIFGIALFLISLHMMFMK